MNKLCAVVLLALVACTKKNAAPVGLYCEGGVIKEQSGGGECMTITPEGKATLHSKYMTPFVMQPDGTSKTKFRLMAGGVQSGTLDVGEGDWIAVKLAGSSEAFHMRSDAPGFLN